MSTLAANIGNIFNKESISYQGMFLALIAGFASSILLLVNSLTADTIAEKLREDQLSALSQVLPQDLYANDLLTTQKSWLINERSYQVFTAKDENDDISGYALQFDEPGFSGPITMLVGLDAQFSVLGVRVLAHTETPGLGDKIEIARSDWIISFNGLSLENTPEKNWFVEKDGGQFDQFTGATITPRAVVNGVYQTLTLVDENFSKTPVTSTQEEQNDE